MEYHIMATLAGGKQFSCTKAECGFRTTSRKSSGFYFDKHKFKVKANEARDLCCEECLKMLEK